MSASTTPETPETELTPELIDRGLRLSHENREKLALLLLDSLEGDHPNSDADWAYWKAEIKKRIEDIESGRVKALTHDEAMAAIRKAGENRGP